MEKNFITFENNYTPEEIEKIKKAFQEYNNSAYTPILNHNPEDVSCIKLYKRLPRKLKKKLKALNPQDKD